MNLNLATRFYGSALYYDLLGAIQGVVSKLLHVVTPDPGNSVQTYRLIENGGGRLRDLGLLTICLCQCP
jgi:hypothetical protein